MLRASAMTTETEVDIQGINGDSSAANVGLPFGEALMAFAESLVSRDEGALTRNRENLMAQAGSAVLIDAAGVAANFQRLVRIADSMGIPIDDMENELGKSVREELQLDRFQQQAS